MKKMTYMVCLTAVLAILVGCKADEEEDVNPTTSISTEKQTSAVNSALIDIPSSISSVSSSRSSLQAGSAVSSFPLASTTDSGDANVQSVYDGIRQNIGAMEVWVTMIRTFTQILYSTIGTTASGDWTNITPSSGEPSRVVWGPDNTHGYDSKFELYYNGQVGFQAYLTINETAQTAKGIYTWDFSVMPSEDASSDSKVQFSFDSTGTTTNLKTMTIKVQGMNGSSTDGPKNAWLKMTQNAENVITLWGNYYFPNMGWFDDASSDARNYVFAVSGYNEAGKSETLKNMAVMQLALPESDTTSDTYWNSASVSAVFVEKLKAEWSSNPLINITTLGLWTGINLSPAVSISDLTYSQVISILEWARTHSNDTGADEIANLIYISKMVNPVYFNSDGFLGTCYDSDNDGTCDQGTLTDVPSGFADLDISSVASDTVSPAMVKNLTVGFME